MSGNICRCGSYPNIVDAIMVVKKGGQRVNNNFADYHVAVNAVIPKPEVIFVDKPDPISNPQGSKGMGEVGIVVLHRLLPMPCFMSRVKG